MLRVRRVSWLLCLLVMLVPACAWASVRVVVQNATGDAVKIWGTFAFDVTISNDGPAVDAVVEAMEGDAPHHRTESLERVEQPIHLPGGSRKRVSLVFPHLHHQRHGYGRQAEFLVRVRDAHGTELARSNARVRGIGEGDLAFVVLSAEKAGFDYLAGYRQVLCPGLQSYQNPVISVAYPAMEGLPEHWSAYGGVDMVVLVRPAQVQWSVAQQRAVLDWVASGGTLLVLTGTDAGEVQGSALADVLPRTGGASLLGATSASVRERAAFQDLSRVRALDWPVSLPAPFRVLRSAGARPLLAVRPWGRGAVVASAVDVAAAGTMSDAGLRDWWRAIMKAHRERESRRIDLQLCNSQVLANPPEITPPSMGFLSLFLLAWVVVVGPMNFFILRRLDRMPWMYVTVPLLALLFTGGSFLVSVGAKGRETVVRQVAVVEAVQGMPTATVWTCASVFSARNSRRELVTPGASTLLGEMTGNSYTPTTDFEAITVGPDSLSMRGVLIPMWSMRRFAFQTMHPLPGSVDLDVTCQDGRFSGRVGRGTGMALRSCVLLDHDQLSSPFELPEGGGEIPQAVGARKVTMLEMANEVRRSLLSRVGDAREMGDDLQDVLGGSGGTRGLIAELRRFSDRGPVLVGLAEKPVLSLSAGEERVRRQSMTLVVVHAP